jgi:hypothetical protein
VIGRRNDNSFVQIKRGAFYISCDARFGCQGCTTSNISQLRPLLAEPEKLDLRCKRFAGEAMDSKPATDL